MPKTFDAPEALRKKVVKLYESGEIGSVKASVLLGCTPITALRFFRSLKVEVRGRGRPRKK